MPTYIKTGYWTKLKKGFEGYLNLDNLVREIVPSLFNQYTGYFSQVGTNAPIANSILKDSIGSPVWSYSAVGIFLLTKTGAFVANKTVPDKIEIYIDNDGNKLTIERTNVNVMTLKTYAAVDTTILANSVLTNQFINIEVYL